MHTDSVSDASRQAVQATAFRSRHFYSQRINKCSSSKTTI